MSEKLELDSLDFLMWVSFYQLPYVCDSGMSLYVAIIVTIHLFIGFKYWCVTDSESIIISHWLELIVNFGWQVGVKKDGTLCGLAL